MVNHAELLKLGTKLGIQGVLKEINKSFEEEFQQSFTETLVKHGGTNLQIKATPTQRKKQLRKIYRRCRDKENDSLKKTTPLAVLTEDESLKGYGSLHNTSKHHLLREHKQNPTRLILKM